MLKFLNALLMLPYCGHFVFQDFAWSNTAASAVNIFKDFLTTRFSAHNVGIFFDVLHPGVEYDFTESPDFSCS